MRESLSNRCTLTANYLFIRKLFAAMVVLAFVFLINPKNSFSEKVYVESGGVVMMEAENTESSLGLWVNSTTFPAFSGVGHLEFTGNAPSSGSPHSPIKFMFKIETEGDYALNFRGRSRLLNGEATDLCNDAFVRVIGDYTVGAGGPPDMTWLENDTKMFVGRGGNGDWGWSSQFDINHVQPKAIYHFKAGEIYTLIVSGRSQRFNLDRILFVNTSSSTSTARALTAESTYYDDGKAVERYTYEALHHFTNIQAGAVNYYKDIDRHALAIDASVVADRNQFARATATFTGKNNNYDIKLTTLAEFDGECTYRFLVNGVVKGTFQNPKVAEADDYQLQTITFKNIIINTDDVIAVESNTHTNGDIPEAGGTAWARGRWSKIAISPAVFQGRVAVVADGNYRDSDDIAGTPITLAILRALGLEQKLVHYSHSCDLVKGGNDPGGEYREDEMQISCDGTASRWSGFEHLNFYNCLKEKAATITDLKNQINNSSKTDPLWIIEAGEPDIMWEAVNQAEVDKRKFINIITHHPANDVGDVYDLSDVMALGIPGTNLYAIPDQNTLLKSPLSDWHWARDHTDDRIKWLWERGYKAQTALMNYPAIVGKFDCSDAGMVYYWATIEDGGDTECDVPKLKKLFLDYIPVIPPDINFSTPNSGSIFIPGSDISVTGIAVDNADIQKAELYVNDVLVREISTSPYEWGATDEALKNMAAGTYVLRIMTTDSNSKTKNTSITVFCNEPAVQAPFSGTPISIPGTFEAEDYDTGEEGLSYHDSSPGNDYGFYNRTDGVDIGEITPGQYCVGGTQKGEWVEYTINVAEAGLYDVKFIYSSGSPTIASIGASLADINQELFTGFIATKTTNWGTYETITKEDVQFPAGVHEFRITVEERAFNIDKISIVKKVVPKPWIDFDINVAEAGLYDIEFQYTSVSATPVEISASLEDLNQSLFTGFAMPTTSASQATIKKENVQLPVGQRKMRITLESGTPTINGITLVKNIPQVDPWIDFDINVAAAGLYNIEFSYTSVSATAVVGASLEDLSLDLFTAFELPATSATLSTIIKENVQLPAGQRKIRIRIENGTPDIDGITLTLNPTISIDSKFTVNELDVYPNPSNSGLFHINTTNTWTIYSTLGVKVLTGNGTSIDLSTQPKGMYILKTGAHTKTLLTK